MRELVNFTSAQLNRALGILPGLAVGDALGAGYEFQPPLAWSSELVMKGGGPVGWAPAEWTDDTSQAVILGSVCSKFQNLFSKRALDQASSLIVDWAMEARDVGGQTREVISIAQETFFAGEATWDLMNRASINFTNANQCLIFH